MKADEYLKACARIEEVRKTALDAATSQYASDLATLNRAWELLNGDSPPPETAAGIIVSRNGKVDTFEGPMSALSQKAKIRHVISKMSDTAFVDTVRVTERFGQMFCDDEPPLSSTVRKVLNEMADKGELERVSPAEPQTHTPAKFKKK